MSRQHVISDPGPDDRGISIEYQGVTPIRRLRIRVLVKSSGTALVGSSKIDLYLADDGQDKAVTFPDPIPHSTLFKNAIVDLDALCRDDGTCLKDVLERVVDEVLNQLGSLRITRELRGVVVRYELNSRYFELCLPRKVGNRYFPKLK
jgi:hypothetical protein